MTPPDVSDSGVQQYIYRWNRQGRKGQRCQVLARSSRAKHDGRHAPASVLLEFADGYRMVTSGNALKRSPEPPSTAGRRK